MNEVFSFIGKKINTLSEHNMVPDYFFFLIGVLPEMNFISFAANSSTPLKITSTDQGIRLYTFVSYYNDLLQVTWHYKYVLGLDLYCAQFTLALTGYS